jgi:hypothetical protein
MDPLESGIAYSLKMFFSWIYPKKGERFDGF